MVEKLNQTRMSALSGQSGPGGRKNLNMSVNMGSANKQVSASPLKESYHRNQMLSASV